LEFSSVAKSLKTLADAEIASTTTMNAIQTAFAKELDAQKQIAVRRDQLFNVLEKITEFGNDHIVKAALIIGQNDAKLNMFFTTPDEYNLNLFVKYSLKVLNSWCV
jgi:hypothetical protein